MLKCTPSKYTIRQCSCRRRSRHASNCWVSVWLRRLMVLATSSHSQQSLSHFSHFVRADSSHEHLRESFGDVRFIPLVAFKGLGMELAFPVSGHASDLRVGPWLSPDHGCRSRCDSPCAWDCILPRRLQ